MYDGWWSWMEWSSSSCASARASPRPGSSRSRSFSSAAERQSTTGRDSICCTWSNNWSMSWWARRREESSNCIPLVSPLRQRQTRVVIVQQHRPSEEILIARHAEAARKGRCLRMIGFEHIDEALILIDHDAPAFIEVLERLVERADGDVLRIEVRKIAVGVFPGREPADALAAARKRDVPADQLDGEVLNGLHVPQ